MGVFAFAMVAMLGLMPSAFQATRDSLDITTAGQAADRIAAAIEHQGAAAYNATSLYLNDLGEETTQTAAIYHAAIEISTTSSAHLSRVQITISRGEAPRKRHFSYLIFNH